jgi:magnesium chelatase family protein
MAMASVLSRAQEGMEAPLVSVEVDVGAGLPVFSIVGLPEAVVKESKDRVRAALANSGFEFPDGRIVVNLSPADLPKEGGRFDLPIAIGILLASDQLPGRLECCELYGELSLSGDVRAVKGALLAAVAAAKAGHSIIVPEANGTEARLVSGCRVAVAANLLEVASHISGAQPLTFIPGSSPGGAGHSVHDLSEVRGQAHAKRALEIAAAGQHSLMFMGPPGTGKSMLAQRLPGLLPPMTEAEALENAAIRSVARMRIDLTQWRVRPFRAPHHTASAIALVGGGSVPRPGEISLAHNGVLFLDELPEFDRRVLEVLREPLETGSITISRAARHAEFPAAFQLIAAMNPCPCGYLGDPTGRCRCTAERVQRYRARISGPLIDRLDMHVEMPRVPLETLNNASEATESSAVVAARVEKARQVQIHRQGTTNARLTNREIERYCALGKDAAAVLDRAATALGLSARGHHRVLKLARTIADLAGSERIEVEHVGEAVGLRRLDRVRAPNPAAIPRTNGWPRAEAGEG